MVIKGEKLTTLDWLRKDLEEALEEQRNINYVEEDYKNIAELKGFIRGLKWAIRNIEINK